MNIFRFFPNLAIVEFRNSGIRIRQGLGKVQFCWKMFYSLDWCCALTILLLFTPRTLFLDCIARVVFQKNMIVDQHNEHSSRSCGQWYFVAKRGPLHTEGVFRNVPTILTSLLALTLYIFHKFDTKIAKIFFHLMGANSIKVTPSFILIVNKKFLGYTTTKKI